MVKEKGMIDPIGGSFEDVVDALIGSKKEGEDAPPAPDHAALIQELTLPEGWGVSVDQISKQGSIRLDAEHYAPNILENDKRLRSLGAALAPLSDFADVRLPGMFTRIWAQDAEHGVPYLNATDLMSYFALGVPAQERYLSYASNVKMEPLIVKKGMILVSCSGTIGRVFDVPEELDGWAGTHDIVRIIPHDPAMKGFLRAYLTSEFAQIQILSHTHGGQIDHVTDEQVASCLVPVLDEGVIKRIAKMADKADRMRSNGMKFMHQALQELTMEISNE